jgi:hypothetical protein
MNNLISITTNLTGIIIFNIFSAMLFFTCQKMQEIGEIFFLLKFFLGIVLIFGVGILIGKILHVDKHIK